MFLPKVKSNIGRYQNVTRSKAGADISFYRGITRYKQMLFLPGAEGNRWFFHGNWSRIWLHEIYRKYRRVICCFRNFSRRIKMLRKTARILP